MKVHCSSGVHPFCHWRLFQRQKYIPIMCFMETKIIHYKDKNDTQHSIRCWARKLVNNLLNYVFSLDLSGTILPSKFTCQNIYRNSQC